METFQPKRYGEFLKWGYESMIIYYLDYSDPYNDIGMTKLENYLPLPIQITKHVRSWKYENSAKQYANTKMALMATRF